MWEHLRRCWMHAVHARRPGMRAAGTYVAQALPWEAQNSHVASSESRTHLRRDEWHAWHALTRLALLR